MCLESDGSLSPEKLGCEERCTYSELGKGVVVIACRRQPGDVPVMQLSEDNTRYQRLDQLNA